MIVYEHGVIHLRSIQEVQFFNRISASFAWKKVNKRPSNSNNCKNIRLVNKRILPKEVSQKGQKTGSKNKEKEYLNNIRYPFIIHLVRRKNGKR